MLSLNGHTVVPTMFPDKTSQVWKLPQEFFTQSKNTAHVVWKFENENEIIHLAQLADLINKARFSYATLEITYLPYGRQDKEVANDATFALRSFAKVINTLGFEQVILHDPHSHIATDLIKNSEAHYPTQQVANVINNCDINLICYPDKGALSKYTKIYDFKYIYGEKVRDQLTGNITSYSVVGNPSGTNVLIVDDICDGGATFKLLAKDLLAAGAKSVVLFVTHGIFSRGLQTLKDSGIQRVFTKDGEASELEGRIIYRENT